MKVGKNRRSPKVARCRWISLASSATAASLLRAPWLTEVGVVEDVLRTLADGLKCILSLHDRLLSSLQVLHRSAVLRQQTCDIPPLRTSQSIVGLLQRLKDLHKILWHRLCGFDFRVG